MLTRNVEQRGQQFVVTGVQKHRIFGPSGTSGVKSGQGWLGHSRLFVLIF